MEKVAVLMSTYNGERWLAEQLDSLLTQQGVEVHLIVRDDGSRDGTVALLRRYAEEHPDLQMDIYAETNVGFVKSFSCLIDIALRTSRAQWFALCDQDDVWQPDKLITGVKALQGLPSDTPNMYCSNTLLVDADLKPMRLSWCPERVCINTHTALLESYATGCTMVLNRKAACLYVDYDGDGVRVHDYTLYLICVYMGVVVFDPESHILYRQHTANQIGRPGIAERWRRRIRGTWDHRRPLQTQARAFLSRFGPLLSDADRRTVEAVADYDKSALTKWRLMRDSRFRYRTRDENLSFFLKIILGKI